ncbi:hypothetical protein IE53DRAFT_32846 [Violaceomyces palustris]|uniref:Uncharacterized protein n=1 Tax=Violaceomyces palustris TaxID=1673888 RepID=A0ACD0P7U4_9BASI|nr:hypothetical protein IE53DRAFT_32846 [Violaceomyces palustris]
MYLAGYVALLLSIALEGSFVRAYEGSWTVYFRDEKDVSLMRCRSPINAFPATTGQGGHCSPAENGQQNCHQTPEYQPANFWQDCIDYVSEPVMYYDPAPHCCGDATIFGGLADCEWETRSRATCVRTFFLPPCSSSPYGLFAIEPSFFRLSGKPRWDIAGRAGETGHFQATIVYNPGGAPGSIVGYCHQLPPPANPKHIDLGQSHVDFCDGTIGNFNCLITKGPLTLSDDIRALAKSTHSRCCQASRVGLETECASP